MGRRKKAVSDNLMYRIPVSRLILFPGMELYIDFTNAKTIDILNKAFRENIPVFLSQYFDKTEDTAKLAKYGIIAEITNFIEIDDDIMRFGFRGLFIAKDTSTDTNNSNDNFTKINLNDSPAKIDVKYAPVVTEEQEKSDTLLFAVDNKSAALLSSFKQVLKGYVAIVKTYPPEFVTLIEEEKNPHQLFKHIAFNFPLSKEVYQELLINTKITKRLKILFEYVTKELQIRILEHNLNMETVRKIEENQRRAFLLMQLAVIKSELQMSESSPENSDIDSFLDNLFSDMSEDNEEKIVNKEDDYTTRIKALNLEDKYEQKLLREVKELESMHPQHPDASTIREHLNSVLNLPWGVFSEINLKLGNAEDVLNKTHYGMEKIKERILEIIAVHVLKKNLTGQIICLVGPPGTGKTSIGKAIAEAMGRKYARVSLGGVRDESEIRGHRKTYIGSMPGRIMDAVILSETANPLILLDEVDKLGNDYRGDPASALLEVLDPEQNKAFVDHFIEVPFDLSQVLFVTTANTTDTIPRPLLDRMDVIELRSYTREEKFQIAKRHLLPKQMENNGLNKRKMTVADSVLYDLIDFYTREAGVRKLEKVLAALCRKTAKVLVTNPDTKKVSFKTNNLENYLGKKKYRPDMVDLSPQVGLTNGLAWTAVGGTLLPLEVNIYNGKGTVQLTGSLGDVMKESATLAISNVRSLAAKYNIDENFFSQKDIHIHAPEGATPKDGPSAGVTMVTSLVSALTGIPVRGDVAMTGEITLHGKVLPIGGLREKTMAAYKNNIKTVIIPKDNKTDLADIEDVVKQNLSFVYAENIENVLDIALDTAT